jgi:superfamily II DNA/RNA helicase
MPFSTLGLLPELLRSLSRYGVTAPSPVQMAVVPVALKGTDLLARAPTGSGKTLAYALPLLQAICIKPADSHRRLLALVLVPTRELAVQAGQTLRDIANQLPQSIKVSVVFGGVSINPQMLGLRAGTDVVVATPGRLIDLLNHNAIGLGDIRMLVLDEADRLLDAGFAAEVAHILGQLPTVRQSLFFSATFPPALLELARGQLKDPVHVDTSTEPESAPDIEHRAISVDARRRTQLLRHLISTSHWKRVLVFVATKHAAEIVADKLRKARIHAEPFHGELSQGKRTQVLADFKAARLKVVVATDVASRGLHISELPVVVNYDLPRSAEDYVHRVGRTGRAGEAGLSISLVSADTQTHFRLIEKRHGLDLQLETVPGFEPLAQPPVIAPATGASSGPPDRQVDPTGSGGIKGKRPSKKDKLRAAQAATSGKAA